MENRKLSYIGSLTAVLIAAIVALAASTVSGAVGFQMDLTPAAEQAAASHLPLVIYCFKGSSLDGANFAKAFSKLGGSAVILVIGTGLHGNAPTAQQLGVHSFPTLILWRIMGGKKISAQEVARFSNCQLRERVQKAYYYIATGEAQ
ncbi:MAG: hypothetical protein ACREP6_10095 [Candidatus Binataceae bacterium]